MEPEYNLNTCSDCTVINFNDDPGQDDYQKVKTSLVTNGYCILQLNSGAPIAPEIIGNKFIKLFDRPFINSHLGGQTYTKVAVEKNSKFYINSNHAQPIHTDEGYTTKFPRYSVLYSAREAEAGGNSIIVQFDPLYTELFNKFNPIFILFEMTP